MCTIDIPIFNVIKMFIIIFVIMLILCKCKNYCCNSPADILFVNFSYFCATIVSKYSLALDFFIIFKLPLLALNAVVLHSK